MFISYTGLIIGTLIGIIAMVTVVVITVICIIHRRQKKGGVQHCCVYTEYTMIFLVLFFVMLTI